MVNKIQDYKYKFSVIIPIYNVEQLKKIGSGEQIEVDGKIYTFLSNANYVLKSNLDFLNTLQLIFEKRIEICNDCNICNLYKHIIKNGIEK